MTTSLSFVVDIRPAPNVPVMGKGRGLRVKPGTVSFRYTGHRRTVAVVNKLAGPIRNVEVRERHRAIEWLSMRRPRLFPGITRVKLGQDIDDPANVYLRFEDSQGMTWICHSDGRLEEVR